MKIFAFENGKYKLVRNADGIVTHAFRYDEPWPVAVDQFRGNKLLNAMLDALEDARSPAVVSNVDVEIA